MRPAAAIGLPTAAISQRSAWSRPWKPPANIRCGVIAKHPANRAAASASPSAAGWAGWNPAPPSASSTATACCKCKLARRTSQVRRPHSRCWLPRLTASRPTRCASSTAIPTARLMAAASAAAKPSIPWATRLSMLRETLADRHSRLLPKSLKYQPRILKSLMAVCKCAVSPTVRSPWAKSPAKA